MELERTYYSRKSVLRSKNCTTNAMLDADHYTKTLGIEWNSQTDHFRLTVSKPSESNITKRALVSDIAKTFDVFGRFSPSTIKIKILLQQL